MKDLYCFSDLTHITVLENCNKNVIKMIYQVLAFLKFYSLQQSPASFKKYVQKSSGKKKNSDGFYSQSLKQFIVEW